MSLDLAAVLRHAAALQTATSHGELVAIITAAVRELTRYQQVWTGMVDAEHPGHLRVLAFHGDAEALLWESGPLFPIAGDAMIAEILERRAPVVVIEAATDPRTNKATVAMLGNRTIINVPVLLGADVVGTLGLGTFGDEGPRPPTDEELARMVVIASLYGAAFDRVRMLGVEKQREAERQALQLQLESLQRVELLGVLSAGLAHDLNNYLTIIGGSLEFLEALPPPNAEVIQEAAEAVGAAGRVVKQLLALGRRESGQRERIDLNEVVASTLSLVRRSVPRAVTVTHTRNGEPLVYGDRVQLEQALANLVINARDAVQHHGAITVTVDSHRFDDHVVEQLPWARPGEFARVRVQDTGPGIPPALRARIFDPLFTSKPTGTGLGLAVVSRVVAQHQGLLHCESAPGQGAVFDIFLPAA
ncbi:MAG: GAF domain-containing protein [Deltaproteobacteria bacterium]|nr:GAF domain-containing protein [Deltaproteobacteria bacterium]